MDTPPANRSLPPTESAKTPNSLLLQEPVLTISQIADKLHIDRHVVTRLFANERGVICIGEAETRRGKRKYRTLRIPVSVFNRVIVCLLNK